ncbi:MAG: acyltransferase [Proteobacteria bacterium]|nr:acyltransferase [Pseudomonadota bacterium]
MDTTLEARATPSANDAALPTSGPAPGERNHFHLLDALRGVAILLVIGHHVAIKFPGTGGGVLAHFLKTAGWAGVDLFFAISGFLITSILFRTRDGDGVKGFFIKRLFRIVPLYVVAVIVYVVVSLLAHHEMELLRRIWVNLGFLTAWLIPYFGREGVPYDITWSVSVEEFAYLTLGLFCLANLRHGARLRPFLWVLVVLPLVLRAWVALARPFDPLLLYFFVPARLDSIAFGGLIALGAGSSLTSRALARPLAIAAVFVSLIGFSVLTRHNLWVQSVGYSVFAICAALLVGALSRYRGPLRNPLLRALAGIGRISYFVYLFHMFVVGLLMTHALAFVPRALGYWGMFALIVAVTCAAGAVSWRWFEKPLIERGRQLANRVVPLRESLPSAVD